MDIRWQEYTEAQKTQAADYRRKTARRGNPNDCFTLAAKSAIETGKRAYLVVTYRGMVFSSQPPAAGQPGYAFEADRWGKVN